MNHLKKRLTYANVMLSIAVFLVLGGASAFAASQLGRNTVSSKQLKRNAVTSTKIKNNAVTGAKIQKNAITGAKIKDGSITGGDIRASSTGFSQVVARIRGTGTASFKSGTLYPLQNPTYTQNAGEDNQFVGGVTVNFPASCGAPRSVMAYLMLDAENPTVPEVTNVIGIGQLLDKGSGSATREMNFSPFSGGTSGLFAFGPPAATNHTFTIFFASESCKTGSGITASGAGVDVIGTK